jgi:hypothetical protein
MSNYFEETMDQIISKRVKEIDNFILKKIQDKLNTTETDPDTLARMLFNNNLLIKIDYIQQEPYLSESVFKVTMDHRIYFLPIKE